MEVNASADGKVALLDTLVIHYPETTNVGQDYLSWEQ